LPLGQQEILQEIPQESSQGSSQLANFKSFFFFQFFRCQKIKVLCGLRDFFVATFISPRDFISPRLFCRRDSNRDLSSDREESVPEDK
jgi:hypothetical protein